MESFNDINGIDEQNQWNCFCILPENQCKTGGLVLPYWRFFADILRW